MSAKGRDGEVDELGPSAVAMGKVGCCSVLCLLHVLLPLHCTSGGTIAGETRGERAYLRRLGEGPEGRGAEGRAGEHVGWLLEERPALGSGEVWGGGRTGGESVGSVVGCAGALGFREVMGSFTKKRRRGCR